MFIPRPSPFLSGSPCISLSLPPLFFSLLPEGGWLTSSNLKCEVWCHRRCPRDLGANSHTERSGETKRKYRDGERKQIQTAWPSWSHTSLVYGHFAAWIPLVYCLLWAPSQPETRHVLIFLSSCANALCWIQPFNPRLDHMLLSGFCLSHRKDIFCLHPPFFPRFLSPSAPFLLLSLAFFKG